MDKTYLHLFKELARTTEILAEQVMESDIKDNDKNAFNTAVTMRQEYITLHNKLAAIEKNGEVGSLTRGDYARLTIGAYMAMEQLVNQREKIDQAIKGYRMDVVPKFNRILSETRTDEEIAQLAESLFQVAADNTDETEDTKEINN